MRCPSCRGAHGAACADRPSFAARSARRGRFPGKANRFGRSASGPPAEWPPRFFLPRATPLRRTAFELVEDLVDRSACPPWPRGSRSAHLRSRCAPPLDGGFSSETVRAVAAAAGTSVAWQSFGRPSPDRIACIHVTKRNVMFMILRRPEAGPVLRSKTKPDDRGPQKPSSS
jgi:hypothetical protein